MPQPHVIWDTPLFEAGPPLRLTALARLPAPIFPNAKIRALVVLLLGWVALGLLVVLFGSPGSPSSFVDDIATHARLAVAAPLLVMAHTVCARRLDIIARHFLASGLLSPADQDRFADNVERIRGLSNSAWAEAAVILLAYASTFLLFIGASSAGVLFSWQRLADGSLSVAGWWNVLVSVPLLLALLLGWAWRIILWVHFLDRTARLDLRLIAAHPDQAGGVGFLTQSVRAFAILGTALGAIAAGRFTYVHLNGLATRYTDGLLIGGVALLVMILCAGPLLVFSARLMQTWRLGSMAYGALGTELGKQFERQWLKSEAADHHEMLSAPDFSAAADLYQVVGNVYAMRFVPIDVRSVLILLGMTLAPFVPAMFLSMPIDVVLAELKGLLL
ncbi:hypothetical protein [Sphingomonas cavernae]|uniref:hypothetical protein n=1 Tax=Sphingomonas cavernae TaxID=2320861 RepID=UPI001EE51C0C|nr:hypothetical protein [Sphingomonas cavernae]